MPILRLLLTTLALYLCFSSVQAKRVKGEIKFNLPANYDLVLAGSASHGVKFKKFAPSSTTDKAKIDEWIDYFYTDYPAKKFQSFANSTLIDLSKDCTGSHISVKGSSQTINAYLLCSDNKSQGLIQKFVFFKGTDGIYHLVRSKKVSKLDVKKDSKTYMKKYDQLWNPFFKVKFTSDRKEKIKSLYSDKAERKEKLKELKEFQKAEF